MARTDLTAMLNRLPEDELPAPEPPTATADPAPDAPQARKPDPASKASPPVASAGYRSFDRKEARLRADQYAKLTEEARRLNRAKGTGGERITENTLIRVAIDLLLERADQLAGTTEAELRKSVSL